MKKIGIVCDNYKLPLFKKELDAAGFTYTVHDFTKKAKSIIVPTTLDKAPVLLEICKKIEAAKGKN